MQRIEELMLLKAKELLESGKVDRVIGWKKGDFIYDNSPATFTADNLEGFTYNWFCGANLSKYLVGECKKGGKIGVFLKPCDTYSFNQLVSEHRISRDMVYVVGIECLGKLDIRKFNEKGIDGVTSVKDTGIAFEGEAIGGTYKINKADAMLIKCETCKSKEFAVADEKIVLDEMYANPDFRFEEVAKLEAMTEEERYAFWKGQLSKCIRCNACRNVCPACTCTTCVFDNPKSGIASKANSDSFEEKLYHIIRAFHVAGRCTDCGECSRVCPQGIPLHLINRKIIKDINKNYGEYQAGATVTEEFPLINFDKNDAEPKTVVEGK